MTKRKKLDCSQWVSVLVIVMGFVIVQECFAMMYLCVRDGYTSTAAWLTAAVGLAEAVIGVGVSGYLSLCKSDHSEGGITFESAKAKNFELESKNSPPI